MPATASEQIAEVVDLEICKQNLSEECRFFHETGQTYICSTRHCAPFQKRFAELMAEAA